MCTASTRPAAVLLAVLALAAGCGGDPPAAPAVDAATVADVTAFFHAQGKTVLTFIGYSGAGYEDEAAMLAAARKVLETHDPARTLVNIGVTPDGIGAVYPLAKEMGFVTTGIVSTQARKYEASASPHVDHAFYVQDETWGGRVEGSDRLAPTSEAMVGVSDVLVGIGGGEIGRDELLAAKKRGKTVTFVPADMDHARAVEKAKKNGRPTPTDFRGAAHAALAPGG